MKPKLLCCFLLFNVLLNSVANAQSYFSPASATLSIGETGDFVIPECELTLWTHYGPYFSTDNGVTWKNGSTDFDGTMTFESNFLPGGGVGGILSVKANKYYAPIKVRYYYLCSETYEIDPSTPDKSVAKYWYNATITFNNTTPIVTTTDASIVAATSATLGGIVTDDGGASVTERGIVWATTANPTTANNKEQIGTGTGNFSQSITSLPSGTTINFRAYAKNTQGTSYGANKTFTTTSAGITASITNSTNVKCRGASTGTATAMGVGSGPFSYIWAPSGGNTPTASNLAAGTYTVTVTDGSSTATATVAITQPAAALTASITSQTNVTATPANGSATVTAAGGTPAYTYSWSPSGGTAATANNLAVNTYTVTVTDANTCTATATANITVLQGLTTTISSSTNVKCRGASTGSATAATTGIVLNFISGVITPVITLTYSWAPSGGTGATATNLAAGTYTVTATYGTSTATATVTITQPATALTASITAQTNVSAGNNGSASVTATGGTGAPTYLWSPSGGTAATASNLAAGNYTVTVTDANTCTATATVTITQPITASISNSTNVSCRGGSTGAATVLASGGGAYTYNWSPSGGTAATASNLVAGNYTVTVTSGASTATATVNITQPATAVSAIISSQTVVLTPSANNGSATVTATGGTGAYTYSWAPTGGTATTGTNLSLGTYTVTVTDANACTATATVNITLPVTHTPSIDTFEATNIGATSATFGGIIQSSGGENVSDRGIVWATTTLPTIADNKVTIGNAFIGPFFGIVTGLPANTTIYYAAFATNLNGTAYGMVKSLTTLAPLSASISASTNVGCYGASTGSATVTASGGSSPYTYSWSPNSGTTATISNLAIGTYTVTVTDASSSTATATVTITQPIALSLISSPQSPIDCGTGTVELIASGGTSPYTYNWSYTLTPSPTAANLQSGTYIGTVTDANTCTANITILVLPPPAPPTLVFTGDTEICVDERTTISARGCAGIVTWSNGHVGYSLNAPIGTYTAICTVNGCSSTSSSPAIVGLRSDCNALTITPVNATLCPGKTVTLKVTGCVGNVTWSTGASGTSIAVSATGQYIASCSTGGVGAATVRTYNLTLNIGTNVILGTEVIKAIETITANNIIGAPIYEKPNVSYSAGKSIVLTPGFKVTKGSVFEATIGGCNN